ncbi:hypothetical protein RF11_08407 [Thelohanellus kitauei]|uniref:Uncharacterized protein n=1 Tax=Thelohanellus kitauei TaxID=669202 RepID=A0A0C2M7Z1_THEKT|nr:hypothetical protein RF11_08407 [Thelohanellus kitauei]
MWGSRITRDVSEIWEFKHQSIAKPGKVLEKYEDIVSPSDVIHFSKNINYPIIRGWYCGRDPRSKLGKNKQHKGHPVNEALVLGSVQKTDPVTGAHKNTIKGTWNDMKHQLPPRNRKNFLDEDGNVVENLLDDL